MDGDEFVSMREAQEILGVSNFTIWRMVRDGELAAYQSRTDRRKKLVRRSDLEALRQPEPITTERTKKDAA
ncbi:MAG: helix-turn-helix domain-containing protein [Chloroflexota bacterium]|nr:helix-turn-helix domain-containing protein [Chloroflexota bacterium]